MFVNMEMSPVFCREVKFFSYLQRQKMKAEKRLCELQRPQGEEEDHAVEDFYAILEHGRVNGSEENRVWKGVVDDVSS